MVVLFIKVTQLLSLSWTIPSSFYLLSHVQVFSMLGGAFKEDSSSAFAIFKFMQSGSSAIAFAYSSKLGLYWQLLIGRSIVSAVKVKLPVMSCYV